MKLLLDAANTWYRAYTATMLDPPGGPIMIMTNILRNVCDRFGTDNVILCLEKGSSGRKELDPEYKAGRTPAEGVWEDFPHMLRMVEALGLTTAYCMGFEADDVIGSIAVADGSAMIQSYDKDFYQLVTEEIKVLRPAGKVHGKPFPEKIVDRTAVLEEFGCEPHRVPLIKAFRGDNSDNIPKIDIRFTKKFKEPFFKAINLSDSVEQFYEHLSMFDKKYHDKLLLFKDRAILNYQLATIQTNLDVQFKSSTLAPDVFESLSEEFAITRLNVAKWQELSSEPAPTPPTQGTLF